MLLIAATLLASALMLLSDMMVMNPPGFGPQAAVSASAVDTAPAADTAEYSAPSTSTNRKLRLFGRQLRPLLTGARGSDCPISPRKYSPAIRPCQYLRVRL